jgi:hypothetical protein
MLLSVCKVAVSMNSIVPVRRAATMYSFADCDLAVPHARETARNRAVRKQRGIDALSLQNIAVAGLPGKLYGKYQSADNGVSVPDHFSVAARM